MLRFWNSHEALPAVPNGPASNKELLHAINSQLEQLSLHLSEEYLDRDGMAFKSPQRLTSAIRFRLKTFSGWLETQPTGPIDWNAIGGNAGILKYHQGLFAFLWMEDPFARFSDWETTLFVDAAIGNRTHKKPLAKIGQIIQWYAEDTAKILLFREH